MPFTELLKRYKRIAITGAPRTGKTSLTRQVTDRPVYHTDDWKDAPWTDVPHLVKAKCETEEAFVLEGVQVPRTLRKGLEVDAVIYLTMAKVEQTPPQIAMGKGVDTVLSEWRAANPDVPVITEHQLASLSLTMDRADVEQTPTKRRYLQFTVDGASYVPTPQGGRRYRARASQAGVWKYKRPEGIVREYRPPAEIKKALHSLKSAPIVLLHPKENGGEVNPDNMRRLRIGVFEDPTWNDATQSAEGYAVIDDAEALDLIDNAWRGKVSISCGYDNAWLMQPGVSPSGDEYDRVQIDYVFNHVGIGPDVWGRQGEDVGLLTLDANDNEEDPMRIRTADANDTNPAPNAPVGAPGKTKTKDEGEGLPGPGPTSLTPEDIAGIKQLIALLPALNQLANTGAPPPPPPAMAPAPTLDSQPGAAPKTEPEKKTLDAKDVERIAEVAAQEGAEVRTDAQRLIGPNYSYRGKSTRQVQLDVVKTFDSDFNEKGLSDEALKATYNVAVKALEKQADHKSELAGTRSGALTQDSKDKVEYRKIGSHVYENSGPALGRAS